MRNRSIFAVIGIVVAVLVVISITILGRQNQTTQQELLPGTTQPALTSEQIIEGQQPEALPAP